MLIVAFLGLIVNTVSIFLLKGKGPTDPIAFGKDIDAMTGATISSRVMAEGIRNATKCIKPAKITELDE